MSKADLSKIPAVEKTLQALGDLDLPRPIILKHVRDSIKELRDQPDKIQEFDSYLIRIRRELKEISRTRILPVLNGTGVLIHTNMGRSPLPDSADCPGDCAAPCAPQSPAWLAALVVALHVLPVVLALASMDLKAHHFLGLGLAAALAMLS